MTQRMYSKKRWKIKKIEEIEMYKNVFKTNKVFLKQSTTRRVGVLLKFKHINNCQKYYSVQER